VNQPDLVIECLRKTEFLSQLRPPLLEDVARCARRECVLGGRALFSEGSRNERLYLVHSGTIALEMRVPGRGNVRILTISAGEMVGWSALLGQQIMSATAIVLEDTELLSFSAVELQTLCDHNHEIGYVVMHRMAVALSGRLLATRLQLLDLFNHPEHGRPVPKPRSAVSAAGESVEA
jgi:CRP/FNR family cyclic AMP-dependent transcriptional regulator